MHIAYLITRMDSIGGAQIHVRDMCTWLLAQGHTPHVICGQPGKTSDLLASMGVTVHVIEDLVRPIRPLQDIRAGRALVKLLQELQPDILSCHSSKAGILGRIAARITKTPVLFTAHGWAFTAGVPAMQARIYKFIERACGPISDHIITVSEYDRKLGLAANIAPADKITTIHNGMPWRDSQLVNRGSAGAPQLIMTARYGPQKDHTTLLRALSGLQDRAWELHLVGGGDDTDMVQLAESLHMRDRIIFHGERTDLPDFLESMDIFLLISHWEGFPRSILEAMRARLPVIATAVAGVPESVRDQETGLLVAENDVTGLQRALAKLIDDADLRTRYGDAGRDAYERAFTLNHMAQPTLALYQRYARKA